jgi:hypothetical protein
VGLGGVARTLRSGGGGRGGVGEDSCLEDLRGGGQLLACRQREGG